MLATSNRRRTGEQHHFLFNFVQFLPNLETEFEPGLCVIKIGHGQKERHTQQKPHRDNFSEGNITVCMEMFNITTIFYIISGTKLHQNFITDSMFKAGSL